MTKSAPAPKTPKPNAPQRRALALVYGSACHGLFALGVGGMIAAMYFGLSRGFGAVPWPWAVLANLALLLQFPAAHSVFLTGRGRGWLARLGPAPHGKTLATTTYAMIASVQLMLLFAFWTPSGIVWWRAEGTALWAMSALYASAWLLLGKAILDAGWQLQAGATGWVALFAGRAPRFPDMPTGGLFRLIRQPIYLAFALTLWTVPTWTPDQLALAVAWTAYCALAPRLKERRFTSIYGARFEAYSARVPYWLPWGPRRKEAPDA